MRVNHDDHSCPHCYGANTGRCSAGKYEFYTTWVQQADGAVAFYACGNLNRKHCPNFEAVQFLREAALFNRTSK
jgi:hypothetical protein